MNFFLFPDMTTKGVSVQLPTQTGGSLNIDDLLSKALSESVACLFSSTAPIPNSGTRISSVPQDTQPIPFKWQTEVAIDDQTVFDPPPSVPLPPNQAPISPSSAWAGSALFDEAVKRLGLGSANLGQLADSEDSIVKRFGPSILELSKMKKIIKNELKDYDFLFKQQNGREPSRSDKEPMRMLYTLYRKLRDILVRMESGNSVSSPQVEDPQIQMLETRLEALYEEKQTVRAVLQEYQSRFLQEQGRRIKYHRDIVAVDREYRQYKQLKEEITKLEGQLGRTAKPGSTNDFFP